MLPDEPTVHLVLSMHELRHIIAALIYCTNDEEMDLTHIEINDHMIDLLLQLEQDLVRQMNADLVEEDWVRKNGEV